MSNETVLVTGGTGFLAGHCIARLVHDGYQVRFTVRSVDRAREAQGVLEQAGVPTGSLTFAVADLTADANWAEAMKGCDYVLHTASPLPRRVLRTAGEVTDLPKDAALRVLRTARDAGARRVVLTSSFAAIGYGYPRSRTDAFTEQDWTRHDSLSVPPYVRAKTIAERAAWAYVDQHDAERGGNGMELATVNPVGMFGPLLGAHLPGMPLSGTRPPGTRPAGTPGTRLPGSVGIVKSMLDGEFPRTPRLWTSVVDVRDVADLHVRAMTSPKAAGERFLAAAGDAVSYHHIAQTLRDRLGDEARGVPDRDVSSFYVRAMAPFIPALRQFRRNLDVIRHTDNSKARQLLGWDPRPPEDAITATARSLLELGLVSR